jgi:hypothetical protein
MVSQILSSWSRFPRLYFVYLGIGFASALGFFILYEFIALLGVSHNLDSVKIELVEDTIGAFRSIVLNAIFSYLILNISIHVARNLRKQFKIPPDERDDQADSEQGHDREHEDKRESA